AVRLETRPIGPTSTIDSRVIVIATVTDAKGAPMKRQKIEWKLDGVGHILEVDRGGILFNHGSLTDTQTATTYTGWDTRKIEVNTGNPRDVIELKEGQTWCVIRSANEGESQVAAFAPDLPNRDSNLGRISHRWIDAVWSVPPSFSDRAG